MEKCTCTSTCAQLEEDDPSDMQPNGHPLQGWKHFKRKPAIQWRTRASQIQKGKVEQLRGLLKRN